MQLRQLQQDLQSYLYAQENAIAQSVADAPPLSVTDRLDIYQNAYRVRLQDALADSYPVLFAVLGDEEFGSLAQEFIAANPSVHRSLRWYGAELAQYLGERQPWVQQPIFSELALLEWSLSEVFDSTDANSISRDALSSIRPEDWGGLTFGFHPSLRRIQLSWNTVPVWRAMSRDETPPDPACAKEPVPWLLWRQNLQNYFRSLPADEAAALDAAKRGATFSDICQQLSLWQPDDQVPLRAASLLGGWADGGLICTISPQADSLQAR